MPRYVQERVYMLGSILKEAWKKKLLQCVQVVFICWLPALSSAFLFVLHYWELHFQGSLVKGKNCWKLDGRKRGKSTIFSLPFSGVSSRVHIFTVIPGPLENLPFMVPAPKDSPRRGLAPAGWPWLWKYHLVEVAPYTVADVWDVPQPLCVSAAPLQPL